MKMLLKWMRIQIFKKGCDKKCFCQSVNLYICVRQLSDNLYLSLLYKCIFLFCISKDALKPKNCKELKNQDKRATSTKTNSLISWTLPYKLLFMLLYNDVTMLSQVIILVIVTTTHWSLLIFARVTLNIKNCRWMKSWQISTI